MISLQRVWMRHISYGILASFIGLIVVNATMGQAICGYDSVHQRLIDNDALYSKRIEDNRQLVRSIIKKTRRSVGQRNVTLYTIPIVVHIMHTGGTEGSIYNPSTIDILEAVEYLNNVYNGTYPGITGAGDIQIQFELAKRTPQNACTGGIIRVNASSLPGYVSFGVNALTSNGCSDYDLRTFSQWDHSNYYNIWVVNKIDGNDGTTGPGYAGYAYPPGAPYPYDGTVLLATHMVEGLSTLPHELGHALNLQHPFFVYQGAPEDLCPPTENCEETGDEICDTDPITEPQNGECRTGINPCTEVEYTDYTEHNFMNYTDCYHLFTEGQKDYMLASMQLPSRASLVDVNNMALVPLTDLELLNFHIYPTYAMSGSDIDVFFAENNLSQVNAGANYTSVYISEDNILTPGSNGDELLGDYFVENGVPANSQTTVLSVSVNIPSSISPGYYYIVGIADGNEELDECNEYNNHDFGVITISNTVDPSQGTFRYWFNNLFSNVIHVNTILNENNLLQESISTFALPQGLNLIHFQVKDSTGAWSSPLSAMFYHSGNSSVSDNVDCQYWFNDEYGNRIEKSISSTTVLEDSIYTGALEAGLHTLNLRFRSTDGRWSSVISQLVYKPYWKVPSGMSQYEYWFDGDYAGRTNLEITPVSDLILLDSLSTDSLEVGLHSLNMRYKPDGGHWSSVTSDLFYKTKHAGGDIVKYQYWFDSDVADTVTVNVPATENLFLVTQIDTPDISRGLHSFHIRHMQEDGLWSSVTSDLFYKDDPVVPNNRIVKFVYWYDDAWQEPQTLFLPGLDNDSLTVYLNAEDLDLGEHTISMYFGDLGDKRSSVISESFTKVDPAIVCPFNDKTFTAGISAGSGATYQWQVDTGSGFVDITDDAVYSGTTDDTLQLTSAPTHWYGNKYRCQITDVHGTVSSEIYTLKFALIWDGDVGTAWEDPNNWSCTAIPDTYTDVFVNTGMGNYPEVSSNASCRTLRLQPGAAVMVKTGFDLEVVGE